MVAVCEANLGGVSAEGKAFLETYNKMLEIVGGRRNITDQQQALTQLLTILDTPQKFAPAILACEWRKVKQGDKYLLRFAIAPAHPLHELADVVHVVLSLLSEERRDGPPPKGPLLRKL